LNVIIKRKIKECTKFDIEYMFSLKRISFELELPFGKLRNVKTHKKYSGYLQCINEEIDKIILQDEMKTIGCHYI
jgi:hypothetical protein